MDFDQTWEKYEKGFGDLESEYTLWFKFLNKIFYFLELTEKMTVFTRNKHSFFTNVMAYSGKNIYTESSRKQ